MSDDVNDELVFDSNGDAVLNPRIREQLRSQEKELGQMKKQLRDSELKAVFAELRIPNEKAGKLFRDTYAGEVTLEAVRRAAEDYDVLPKGDETQSLDPQRQAELDALRRVNNATETNTSSDATEVMQDVLAKLRSAKSTEEFDAIMSSPEVRALGSQPISFT